MLRAAWWSGECEFKTRLPGLRHLGLTCGLLALAGVAGAAKPDNNPARFSGYLGTEVRAFTQSAAFPFQDDQTFYPSLFGQPEFEHAWNDGADRFVIAPFGRYDIFEHSRSHFDLRLANWTHKGESWDVVVGLDRVFWGAAESRHLVDIINQVDLLEDVDEEDRLGQPMINLNLVGGWGRGSLFVLPGFRKREFFAADARLSGGFNDQSAEFESGAEEAHVDFAARYENNFGPLDMGLAYFYGTSREPRIFPTPIAPSPDDEPDPDEPDGTPFTPFYDIIHQVSLDSTLAAGGWLLKLEALERFSQGEPFFAAIGGFEYTFFDAFGSGLDFGLLAEYLFDDRNEDAPPTPFDHDVFGGFRLTLNDFSDTRLLAGAVVDLDTQATFVSIETSRRLFTHWTIEIESRLFLNIPSTDLLTGVEQDDFVHMRLLWNL